jgi:hypothetical protein
MPLAVVLGPAYLESVSLRHLYGEQGYLKTSALIEHMRQDGRLGQMMWIAIQWEKVTAGVRFPLLGIPERFLPHAVGKGYSSLRDFLADSEFTPKIVNTYTDCLRHNVLAGGTVKYKLQRCRLYLQVECLRYLLC